MTLAGSVVSLSIGLLLSAINFCAFDLNFYKHNFRELNTAAQVGIAEPELETAIEVLLAYLKDERQDIDLQVELVASGAVVPMYNARETAHMVDVKALYQAALKVMYIALTSAFCLCCATFSLLYYADVYCRCRKRRRFRNNAVAPDSGLCSCKDGVHIGKNYISVIFLMTALSFFVILGAVAVCIYYNFESFWIKFHELFFSNDLWQLDPATSRMINLVEGRFFNNLLYYILKTTSAAFLFVYLLYFAALRLPLFYRRYKQTVENQ